MDPFDVAETIVGAVAVHWRSGQRPAGAYFGRVSLSRYLPPQGCDLHDGRSGFHVVYKGVSGQDKRN